MNGEKEKILDIIKNNGRSKKSLHKILHQIKNDFKYISEETIEIISKELSISKANIEGVLTFYSFLGDRQEGKYIIRLCKTISCSMKKKEDLLNKIERVTGTKLNTTSEDKLFTIKECNCLGMCDQGPALLINGTLLSKVEVNDVEDIINSCRDNSFNNRYGHRYVSKIYKTGTLYDFLNSNTDKFQDYIETPGREIIEIITAAGLKGRGGAGFPTGLKWLKASKVKSDDKYIVCNADEGEPGTFKDRFLLDNFPEKVIEGMIIGGKAIGANKGIIYLRGEYAYLLENILKTVEKYNFEISVHMGSGSYVCGEETALIESLEGKRGEARNRPPYPVEVGYLGKPTVVNNVETYVNTAFILERGSEEFRSLGTKESNGTKFFSISGDLKNPGIYELPFGITIKELIEVLEAEDIKSVQLGGASGINIAKKDFHKIIAFEAVPSGGSIILFNQKRDMLEVARNFMDFFVDESCGQCVPCREGTIKLLEGIDLIITKQCSKSYLDKLMNLGSSVMESSKCGLGQVCSKGFISIINNHRDEIMGYIKE